MLLMTAIPEKNHSVTWHKKGAVQNTNNNTACTLERRLSKSAPTTTTTATDRHELRERK